VLRIRFADGERPHLFWVSPTAGGRRFKILSKKRLDGSVEALVIEEAARQRRPLARVEVEPSAPAGWLSHWVDTVATELRVDFRFFDLRAVSSADEWNRVADQLGWVRSGRTPGRS